MRSSNVPRMAGRPGSVSSQRPAPVPVKSNNPSVRFFDPLQGVSIAGPSAAELAAAAALRELEELRQNTKPNREQIAQAREEGYRKGFDEAAAMLTQQLLEQRSDLAHLQESTFQSIVGQQASLMSQVAAVLPQLAAEIAARVLAGYQPEPQNIRELVAETLTEITPGSKAVEVYLCPRDYELVKGLEAEFSHKYQDLQIKVDTDLSPGDCRAKSKFGAIDARIATKLRNLTQSLQ